MLVMERKGYYPLQTISFYISTYNLIVCFFLFNKPYGRFSQVVADINDSLHVLMVVFYCPQETSHSCSQIPGAGSGFLGQLQTK